eukprot:gene8890-biopygen19681
MDARRSEEGSLRKEARGKGGRTSVRGKAEGGSPRKDARNKEGRTSVRKFPRADDLALPDCTSDPRRTHVAREKAKGKPTKEL